MPNCGEELGWTALPKLCQKCFGIKRKPVRSSKSHSDSVPESLPKVKRVNTDTECGDEKYCPSNPVLSETSLTLIDNLLLTAPTSVIDSGICSSIKTTTVANMDAASSPSKTSHNFGGSFLSMKQQNIGLNNRSKTLHTGFVRPLFKTSVLKMDAQIKEADIRGFNVNNVTATAAGNVNKNKASDLYRCPLCDLVFDIR